MQTFFMILGLISAILLAISLFGYRHFTNKASSESEQIAKGERSEINDKVTHESSKIIGKNDSVLKQIKDGQNEIRKDIKDTKKKDNPKIDIKDSPNTVIQINEKGDNINVKQGDNSNVEIVKHNPNYYTSPNLELESQLSKELIKFKELHKTSLFVEIGIETGSSIRYKIASKLEQLLKKNGIPSHFKSGTSYYGWNQRSPITIKYNPLNEQFSKDFGNLVKTYINSDIEYKSDETFESWKIFFFINGDAIFNKNGSMKIQ